MLFNSQLKIYKPKRLHKVLKRYTKYLLLIKLSGRDAGIFGIVNYNYVNMKTINSINSSYNLVAFSEEN